MKGVLFERQGPDVYSLQLGPGAKGLHDLPGEKLFGGEISRVEHHQPLRFGLPCAVVVEVSRQEGVHAGADYRCEEAVAVISALARRKDPGQPGLCGMGLQWAYLDSNQGRPGYEPGALTR